MPPKAVRYGKTAGKEQCTVPPPIPVTQGPDFNPQGQSALTTFFPALASHALTFSSIFLYGQVKVG